MLLSCPALSSMQISPIRVLPGPFLQKLVFLSINMIRANDYENEPKSAVANPVDIWNHNFQAIKMVTNKVTITQENDC